MGWSHEKGHINMLKVGPLEPKAALLRDLRPHLSGVTTFFLQEKN